MTKRVVFDENFLIFAHKGKNERGGSDSLCGNLFLQVVQVCYQLVVDGVIWGRYQSRLSRLAKEEFGTTHILATLNRLKHDPKKLYYEVDTPAFAEEAKLSSKTQDDKDFIRLAIHSRAILATTDRALKEELEEKGISAKYQLKVVLAKELSESLRAG